MPLSLAAATAIGAGANFVGNLLGGKSANKKALKQQKHDREMMELQHQQNLESWNLQNAYNTPQAQMQRYQEAGLNKHMVASSGTSGNAQSIAPYQAISSEQTSGLEGIQGAVENAGNSIMQYQTLKRANTENKIAEQELRIKETEADIQEVNANKKLDLYDIFQNDNYGTMKSPELMATESHQREQQKANAQIKNTNSLTALNYAKKDIAVNEAKLSKYGIKLSPDLTSALVFSYYENYQQQHKSIKGATKSFATWVERTVKKLGKDGFINTVTKMLTE